VELDPVEVDAALALALDRKAAVGQVRDAHAVYAAAAAEGVGAGVQELGVHGVGEVVEGPQPAPLPACVAVEARPLGALGLLGELQRGRWEQVDLADVAPDQAGALERGVAGHLEAAGERAGAAFGRDGDALAAAVELEAVVGAGERAVYHLAQRELGVAVGAAVGHRMGLAAGVTPQDEVLAQRLDGHGRRAHFGRVGQRVPAVAQSLRQGAFHVGGRLRHDRCPPAASAGL
jgi:hypothetical protein